MNEPMACSLSYFSSKTIRLHLLKFGAWVESSVRRVVLHLPISTPFANEWIRIARTVGVVPT